MTEAREPLPLDDPVLDHARTTYVALDEDLTVDEALAKLRRDGVASQIFYVYVVDGEDRLAGIVPTRRFLTSPGHARLGDVVDDEVVTVPAHATVLDAVETFLDHRLLAFPVVDDDGRMQGVVDVDLFAREAGPYERRGRVDDVFQWIGLRAAEARQRTAWQVATSRLTWLSATVAGGLGSATIAAFHRATLAEALFLAFFLTLVLGLAESVSIQSMTLALERRRVGAGRAWQREIATAGLLGLVLGGVVGSVAWLWAGNLAGIVVGGSILATVALASMIGLVVTELLSLARDDAHVAAGPVTLMATDIVTLTLYFGLGAFLLGP